MKANWRRKLGFAFVLLISMGCMNKNVMAANDIAMDGIFSDWTAVEKIALGKNNLDEAAILWQNDFIYLYVKENDYSNGCFTWGTYLEFNSDHGVKVSIRTYIGDWSNEIKPLNIQGATGAVGYCAPVGNAWCYEMKFPVSMLGNQINEITLSWADSNEITSLKKDTIGEEDTSEGEDVVIPNNSVIDIDGYYEDWDNIPHGVLTYQSYNNTGHHNAALYRTDTTLYCHIQMNDQYKSQLPMNVLNISVNGKTTQFSLHFPNSDLSIDWNNDSMIYGMPVGITTGLGVFNDGYPVYYFGSGAYVSYNEGHTIGDQLEFSIDLKVLSKQLDIPVESMNTITLTAPNIGAGTITATGTSTGPILGLAICVGGVGVILCFKRRRRQGVE